MENGARILIVDDEPQIRKLLHVSLKAHGFNVEEAASGQEGITRATVFKPDLLIVDLGLPDMDGKQIVRQIREWSTAPIIVLSARDQEQEKIEALDAGADDYVTKPFSVGELMARMRVSLRRVASPEHEPMLQCGDLTIDLVQRRVSVAEREIKLTPTEYELLKILAQFRGRVVTHKQLLKAVWGNNYDNDTHYIRVYIGQLRRKIEENPTQPRYIVTESGIGYRMMG
jgi:two-component system KDP operon response regulator KdpE